MNRAFWFILCASLVLSLNVSADAIERKPNVVVIMVDDQGALDARCYGSKDLETPAIDQLAKRGIRFTQAYAHTVCCPGRAMLMTGRYPERCNVHNWVQSGPKGRNRRNMHLSEVTLAESLRAAGYRTALFGKWHLGYVNEPGTQGFDEYFGIRGGYIDNYVHYSLGGRGQHDLFDETTEVFRSGEYFPEMISDRALAFIEQNRDRPFFLYYAINLPHYPEQPLDHWREHYKNLPEPRASYAAVISTVDEYVGRLIAQLKRLKLLDNTIIVYTSDNGYSAEDYKIKVDNHRSGHPKGFDYGAHGGGGNPGRWIGSKGSLLEGGVRVPALLSYPAKLPQGVVRDQIVMMMDWYPTVLELCGIDLPKDVQFDGHSVLPLVKDASAPSPHKVLNWQWGGSWAVREGDWKLIVKGTQGYCRPKLDRIYLGNLADKRPEATNYAKDRPDVVKRLKKLHQQWMDDVLPNGFPKD